MRLGIYQMKPEFGQKEKNIKKISNLLNKENGGDIVVLPELFNTGYTFISKEEALSLGENDNGETITALKGVSKNKHMGISAGILEKEGSKLYNTSYLIVDGKIAGKYRKMHLYGVEKEIFTKGNLGFPVFSFRDINVGMIICFDWIFPEAVRTLALKGAQIILHSANLILPYCQNTMKTRAIENRVFIATANRIGIEERGGTSYSFTGKSQIVSPEGKIIAKMDAEEENILWVEINPELANNKNINPYNDIFKDRREEYYFK